MARSRSIRAKSVALFVGYVVALCVVYAAFSVHLLQREVAVGHERVRQTARMLAAELDAVIETGRQRLATVAALPGLVYGLDAIQERRDGGPIAPWTTLHYLFFRSPVFNAGVFLAEARGTVLWTEPPGLPWVGRSLDGVAPVDQARRRGEAVVSEGLPADALLAGPHVVVAHPILGPDGDTVGVLGGVIDLGARELTTILHRLSNAEGEFAAVTDAHGLVLAATTPTTPLAPWRSPAPAEEALLGSAPLAAAPWRVVAGQPRHTALAHIRHLQRILLALGVAGLLAAVVIGGTFVHGVVRAAGALTDHAELMARGDLSRPVAVDTRHDEIATLAGSFERMRVELRRSQQALQQRLEEREELIRLKEEFLANVSHELRTPLHVILGYTEMLHDDEPSDERRAVLERVREQSERLLTLVGDLMTLSGIGAGKLAVVAEPVAAEEVLERLVPLVDRLGQGRPIEVAWECAAGLPMLCTDAARLEQVLANLVTNAFKFTAAGWIAIRVRWEPRSQRVVFEVADSGIGIPAHELPHVFDEFRQVDGSMARHHDGMGLGLALVRRLVELLGGEVAVASVPGRGSTFTVALPATPALESASGGTR